jgi:hypothetical protein
MLVTAEGSGENDDVAFVSLNVLDVLYEETHVFAAFCPLTFSHQGVAKGCVIFGALLKRILDRICLLAVERDHPDRGRRRVVPKIAQVFDDVGGFLCICLVLIYTPSDRIISIGRIVRMISSGWRTGTLSRFP